MDNQDTIEPTQTITASPLNVQEPSGTPPSEPPKKKANTPLIIVSILALCFAGLAIFFGIQYFMPKKDTPSEPGQTSTTPTNDQPEPAPVSDTPTMAEEYKEVSDEILSLANTIIGENYAYTRNDSGLTYKPSGFNTSLPLKLNLLTEIYNSKSNEENINSLKGVFENANYTSLGIIPFLGSAGPTIYGYYNSEKDITCGFYGDMDGSLDNLREFVTLKCAKPSWLWLTEEDEKTIKELETAYHDKTNEYPTTLQTTFTIKDSQNTPYQTLQTGLGGGVGLFYRTSPDADWQFFKGTQAALSCSDYDTDDLKKAYQGTVCYDGQAESTVQP